MIPQQWFAPLQKHNPVKHPYYKLAWTLQDLASKIPQDALEQIVYELEHIESGELVEQQIAKLKHKNKLIHPGEYSESELFRLAYENRMRDKAHQQNLFETNSISNLEHFYFTMRKEMKRIKKLQDKKPTKSNK